MSDLEKIVRPFETGAVVTGQSYHNFNEIGVPPLRLQFGRSGQGKTFSGSYSAKFTFYCTKYSVESKDPNRQ